MGTLGHDTGGGGCPPSCGGCGSGHLQTRLGEEIQISTDSVRAGVWCAPSTSERRGTRGQEHGTGEIQGERGLCDYPDSDYCILWLSADPTAPDGHTLPYLLLPLLYRVHPV